MRSGSRIREDWNDIARLDPFWGVLTHPDRKHLQWREDDFFATGDEQVAASLAAAQARGLPRHRGTALDYGCGLGRLTRALSTRFEHVHGVDTSESVIRQAAELNGHFSNCTFHVLADGDLSGFRPQSMDLVYSMLVLQHQTRRAAVHQAIRQFIRLLSPGGLAIFQLPSYIPPWRRVQPRRRLYSMLRTLGAPPDLLYRRLGLDPIRMVFLPAPAVCQTVERSGGKVASIARDQLAGPFPSMTYYVTPELLSESEPWEE